MNNEEKLNLLKQLLTMAGAMGVTFGLLTQSQSSALAGAISVAAPALVTIGSIAWSIYSHWNMKRVPENSTALALPTKPAIGTTVDLAPLTGLAKVVG